MLQEYVLVVYCLPCTINNLIIILILLQLIIVHCCLILRGCMLSVWSTDFKLSIFYGMFNPKQLYFEGSVGR